MKLYICLFVTLAVATFAMALPEPKPWNRGGGGFGGERGGGFGFGGERGGGVGVGGLGGGRFGGERGSSGGGADFHQSV